MYFCCGSLEKAISQTDPAASVFFSWNTSFTKVPSVLKTWMRLLTRSQTYNKPSFASATQCTGLANCLLGGASGLYGPGLASSGLLPYAPQCLLYLPVSASYTI